MAILKLRDNNGNIIEIPAIQGPKGDTGDPGESIGIADYEAGDDYTTVAFTNGDVIQIPSGVGIKNIRLSNTSETGNTYKIELTNGQSYELVAPVGPAGKTGADGAPGADGKTPVKGTDYFTEADKAEIAQQAAELVDSVEAVLYTPQTLTEEQKAQARANIGVGEGGGSVGNEVDPTVPDWAKQPEKPLYNIREIENSVGESVEGKLQCPYTVASIYDYENFDKELSEPVVGAKGAEILNDYDNNVATGLWALATGCGNQALGDFSNASGWLTQALGFCSISSGRQTITEGNYSHAEGHNTRAMANDTHAEGEGCQALNARAHAEGYYTTAKANQAHAEGMNTVASGVNSHAEGWGTTASGQNSFSGGKNTTASGTNSTAKGQNTIAAGSNQTALGKYNIQDTTSLVIIGNGSSDTARSNAFKLDASGNGWFAGAITSNGTPTEDNHVITKKYFEDNIDSVFNALKADIEAALDNIIAIQEELLIPNGDEVSY